MLVIEAKGRDCFQLEGWGEGSGPGERSGKPRTEPYPSDMWVWKSVVT